MSIKPLRVIVLGYLFSGAGALIDLLRDDPRFKHIKGEGNLVRQKPGLSGIFGRMLSGGKHKANSSRASLEIIHNKLADERIQKAEMLLKQGQSIYHAAKSAKTYDWILSSPSPKNTAHSIAEVLNDFQANLDQVNETSIMDCLNRVFEVLESGFSCNHRPVFLYDQVFQPWDKNHFEVIRRLESNWKIIIVDRCIRDQYADIVSISSRKMLLHRSYRGLMGLYTKNERKAFVMFVKLYHRLMIALILYFAKDDHALAPHAAKYFLKWQLMRRKLTNTLMKKMSPETISFVTFEETVLNANNVKEDIYNFLGVANKEYSNKHFVKSKSIKNIGIYKSVLLKSEIDVFKNLAND